MCDEILSLSRVPHSSIPHALCSSSSLLTPPTYPHTQNFTSTQSTTNLPEMSSFYKTFSWWFKTRAWIMAQPWVGGGVRRVNEIHRLPDPRTEPGGGTLSHWPLRSAGTLWSCSFLSTLLLISSLLKEYYTLQDVQYHKGQFAVQHHHLLT